MASRIFHPESVTSVNFMYAIISMKTDLVCRCTGPLHGWTLR